MSNHDIPCDVCGQDLRGLGSDHSHGRGVLSSEKIVAGTATADEIARRVRLDTPEEEAAAEKRRKRFPIDQQLDLNWSRLTEITRDMVVERLAHKDFGVAYDMMLADLKHDKTNGSTLLGMRRAPGSKNRHHNTEGGLVTHILQMWDIWQGLGAVIRAITGVQMHAHLNNQNIWRGILHHDLNKVWKYTFVSDDPWSISYANERDRMTMLLGDTNKSLWLLGKYGIQLSLPLHNALITAEGGFSKGERPSAETVLAKVLYLLDELSANVVDRLQTNRFWDSKVGGISEVP